MKKLMIICLSAMMLMGFAFSASALVIDATALLPGIWDLGVNYWTSDDNSVFNDADIEAITGFTGLDFLYKAEVNVPVTEEGGFKDYYATVFPGADPSGASISWTGSGLDPFISGNPIILDVKDGSQTPAHYLFNLSSIPWDGKETIELRNFWPGTGSISHIAIHGGTQVPDGGATALLLGIAILATGMVSRHIN